MNDLNYGYMDEFGSSESVVKLPETEARPSRNALSRHLVVVTDRLRVEGRQCLRNKMFLSQHRKHQSVKKTVTKPVKKSKKTLKKQSIKPVKNSQ